jgi:4-amino-4-deoxy-L-arabinose transferase-like glycosyltransferase
MGRSAFPLARPVAPTRRDGIALIELWARVSPWLGIAAITVVAGAMRFIDFGHLALRIDEGFTLTYSRQSWANVLGLHGFYDPHPPLYFALAKAANLFVPEKSAARIVSLIAGTATFPVYYALVTRILDRRAALGATALMAVAPIHVEFSRDGRMYAPVVLMILVSYLALVSFWQTERRRWLPVYALSLAGAVYMDYSAGYALAPEGLLLVIFFWRDRRRARWLVGAAIAALVAYAPWLPQIAGIISDARHAERRADYLGASWGRIGAAIPVLFGLNGRGTWVGAPHPSVWDRWHDQRTLLLLGLLPAGLAGIWVLRRFGFAGLIVAMMAIGTPLVAVGASLLSPGFAPRTVLTAVFGWAIAASAFLVDRPLPRWLRSVGTVGWCYLFVMSSLTLPATYNTGRRDQWPQTSADLASQAQLGKPIVIFSTAGMLTDMVDLYQGDRLRNARMITLLDGERETWTGAERWLSRGVTLAQIRSGALSTVFPPDDPDSDAFWFIKRFGGDEVPSYFAGLGFRQITTMHYYETTLELWARPGAKLGTPLAIDGDFGAPLGSVAGWSTTPGAVIQPDPSTESPALALQRRASSATYGSPAGAGLYTVEAKVRVLGWGQGRMTLACISATGAQSAKRMAIASPHGPPGGWSDLQIAAFCPAGTVSVQLILDRRGHTSVEFQAVSLQASPAEGSPAAIAS